MNRSLTFAVTSILLSGCATHSAKPAPAAPAKPTTAMASLPFESEIEAFEDADRATPLPKNSIMFYGSSSFRIWTSIPTDFPGLPVVNRGFGGSHMSDAVRYLDRVVIPNQPKTLLIYEGDNDLASGKTPAQVIASGEELLAHVHKALPKTTVVFVSVKPSPSRVKLMPQGAQINAWFKSMAAERSYVEYVDIATPMLGADGQPRVELFGPDMLHMNAKGYAIWTSVVGPVIR